MRKWKTDKVKELYEKALLLSQGEREVLIIELSKGLSLFPVENHEKLLFLIFKHSKDLVLDSKINLNILYEEYPFFKDNINNIVLNFPEYTITPDGEQISQC